MSSKIVLSYLIEQSLHKETSILTWKLGFPGAILSSARTQIPFVSFMLM